LLQDKSNRARKKQGTSRQMPCLLRTLVGNQFTNFNFKVVAQFADQAGIQPLKIVLTISVEVRSWNVQVFAYLVFRDTSLL
jgi:hypothetical protein